MKKLKIMNTLCWKNDYVIIRDVQIVIIIIDNYWEMIIIITSYLMITLLDEMMQLIKNWRRWKAFHLIWKNDFFYLMKSNVSLKREIERWVKRTHSIVRMWKLRKIFNHLFQYSLKPSHSSHSRLISKSSFCSSCSSSCKHLLHSKFCRRIDSVMNRLIHMCSNSRCQC
jgi:hypothetical protein